MSGAEPISLGRERVSCPRGPALSLLTLRPSPESYAAERRPRAVTAISAAAAASRYLPQVTGAARARRREGETHNPLVSRQSAQPINSLLRFLFPAKLAPGAPSAGAEQGRRGRGGRWAEPGRLHGGSAQLSGRCPGRREPAASPAFGAPPLRGREVGCAAPCRSVCLPRKSRRQLRRNARLEGRRDVVGKAGRSPPSPARSGGADGFGTRSSPPPGPQPPPSSWGNLGVPVVVWLCFRFVRELPECELLTQVVVMSG